LAHVKKRKPVLHLKLSDNALKALDTPALLAKASRPQYEIRDIRLGGFFIIVGRRTTSFAIQADLRRQGQRVRIIRRTIGRFGNITSRHARLIAQQDLLSISRGIIPPHRDRFGMPKTPYYQAPMTDKATDEVVARATPKAGKTRITLRHAWEKYRTNHMERKKRSPNTIRCYQNYITNNISDWLDRPLSSFVASTEEVVDRYNFMIENNGVATANNVMRIFRAVYRYASDKLDRNLPEKHPVTAIDFYEIERRNTAMGPEDLAGWNLQRKALRSPLRREFHLFTLLSRHRPDALKKAKRCHLSLRKSVLHIPEPKGGKDRAFDIPLSRAMRRCLVSAIKAGDRIAPGSEWIFPAPGSRSGHMAEQSEKRTNLSHWGNDLRQTYRTMAEYADIPELQIKILMNHKIDRDVNSGYITVSKLRQKLLAAQTSISNLMMQHLEGSD